MPAQIDGYVTDVSYVRTFVREQAPAWLDHVALLNGLRPPPRAQGFSWCDLGCGPGLTVSLLAGLHPQGYFHGIDVMPEHIEEARGFAREARLRNARFHTADFGAACALDLPGFDYIVAHGVYSWVGAQSQHELLRFVDRFLKPGGLLYLSYNAMPGWAADLGVQKLIQTFAGGGRGNSLRRVAAAAQRVHAMGEARAAALQASPLLPLLRPGNSPVAYLAHEFLGASWKPLYVTQVRAAVAGIGLAPVGSARLIDNYDRFVLGEAARAALQGIEDTNARELARDFFLCPHLRCDVYSRDAPRLSEAQRTRRLAESSYTLAQPAGRIEFGVTTPAGRLGYDNAVARHLVAELAQGPRRLRDITAPGIARSELLANLLTLCAAGQVLPVEGANAPVRKLMATLQRRLDTPLEAPYLPLPCGTALRLPRELLGAMRNRTSLRGFPGWQEFLAAQMR
jgi:hypothetical protein